MIIFAGASLRKRLFFYILLLLFTLIITLQFHHDLVAQNIVISDQNQQVSGLKTIFFLGVSIWEWIRVSFNATVIGLISVFLREFLKNQDEKRKKKEAQVAKEIQQQEKVIREERLCYEKFKDYLDQMTEVLLRKNTFDDYADQLLKAVVRARTILVLQELDCTKRGSVIRFLADCNVINCLDLSKANLREANLKGADLNSTCFRKATFYGANLQDADLSNSNLEYADLTAANLSGADLQGANLKNVIGITLQQIQLANNWQKALYDPEFLQQDS